MKLKRVVGCAAVIWCAMAALVLAQNVLVSQAPSKTSSASDTVAVSETVSLATDEAAALETVEVVSFSGTVEVKRSGSADYQAAEEGMLLVSGDTIKTGSGASAVLGFDEEDKNIVRVEENTTSVILLKGDEKVELLQGEVFSIIQRLPAGSSFEVRTPTAVAGARGTEWATRYDGQETFVESYEDAPFVKMIDEKGKFGEEMKVVTGYATRVARFAPPTRMSEIPAARRQQWQERRQVMRQAIQGIRQQRGRPDRAKFQAQQAALKRGLKGDRAARKLERARQQQAQADLKPGAPGQAAAETGASKGQAIKEKIMESRQKKSAMQEQNVLTTQAQQGNKQSMPQSIKRPVASGAVRSVSGGMQRR